MTQHKTLADEIESMKDAAAIFAAKQGLQRDTEKFKAGADFVFEMLEVFIKEKHASQFIKKDEFIPIGEGEYGLPSAKQTHDEAMRLKQELKELGKDENFVDLNSWIMGANFMEEAALILLKKEVVSSDVEQAATKFLRKKKIGEDIRFDGLYSSIRDLIIEFSQSTQQPAIEWPSESELRQMFKNNSNCYADTREENHDTIPPTLIDGPVVQALDEDQFIYILSKLKERVNCVDPVEFARWFEDNIFSFDDEGTFGIVDQDGNSKPIKERERFNRDQIIKIYLTSKTKNHER